MLNLGDRVKDKITGYTGIVTGVTEWLYGCRGISVQEQTVKDGKPSEALCLDEDRWELVKKNVLTPKSRPPVGGPVSAPIVRR